MKRWVAAILISTCLMVAAQALAYGRLSGIAKHNDWAAFERSTGIGYEVIELRETRGGWIAKRTEQGLPDFKPHYNWTDDKSCPALRQTLRAISNFKSFKIKPYNEPDGPPGIDGKDYELTVEANFGHGDNMSGITLDGWEDSPLADLINAAFDRLWPCLKEGEPPTEP